MEKVYVVKVSWHYNDNEGSEVKLGYHSKERAEQQAKLIIDEELESCADVLCEKYNDFTLEYCDGGWFEAKVEEVMVE